MSSTVGRIRRSWGAQAPVGKLGWNIGSQGSYVAASINWSSISCFYKLGWSLKGFWGSFKGVWG